MPEESSQPWFTALRVAAAVALVLALADWPYGYYQLLRLLVCGTGVYGWYVAYQSGGQQGWLWAFGVLAVLWNPILPINLTRGVWAILDLLGAVLLLASIWRFRPAAREAER